MKFQFTAQENEDSGEIGWMDNRAEFPYGPSDSAFQLAHDCMEHFSMKSVMDEIEAIGAAYWLRYETGYFPVRSPYSRSIGMRDLIADFEFTCQESVNRDYALLSCNSQKVLNDYIEKDIETIISKGSGAAKLELEGMRQEQQIARFAQIWADWFRFGYRKAQKRYAKLGQSGSTALFDALFCLFGDNMPEFEGQKLTVNMNVHTGQVR